MRSVLYLSRQALVFGCPLRFTKRESDYTAEPSELNAVFFGGTDHVSKRGTNETGAQRHRVLMFGDRVTHASDVT